MNKLKQILNAMKLHTAETHPLVETERAMELIETELAKPAQEPVAWRWRWREGTMGILGETMPTKWNFAHGLIKVHPEYVQAIEIEPIYTAHGIKGQP